MTNHCSCQLGLRRGGEQGANFERPDEVKFSGELDLMAPLISSIAPIIAPWPLAPIIKYAVSSPTPADVEPAATRYRVAAPVMTSPWDHLALIITCGWKFIFALAVYYLFPTSPVAAAHLDLRWIAGVVIRDLVITYIVGAWDFVNLSPMSPVFEMMKVRHVYCTAVALHRA